MYVAIATYIQYNNSGYYVQNTLNVMPEEERSHGTISNWTYVKFIQEGGNTLVTVIFILAFILAEVCDINF